MLKKETKRIYRHRRLRKKVSGSAERPRLCVHRSLKNLHAQVIDDSTHKTLLGMSTLDKSVRKDISGGGNIEAAKKFGKSFAQAAKKRGIVKVCFDRGGYLYHGRVKAFADAVKEEGLDF